MGRETQEQKVATQRSKKRGFTLIELMVVLVIISILGSKTVPTIADAWDQFMLRRIAAKVLVIISVARQHAIADERATLIHFNRDTWCIQYQDESEQACSLGLGRIPSPYYFNATEGTHFSLLYSARRGFSPLSSGATRLYSERSRRHVYFINSSIGRVRLCSVHSIPGIAAC